jgi:hypothetical protein
VEREIVKNNCVESMSTISSPLLLFTLSSPFLCAQECNVTFPLSNFINPSPQSPLAPHSKYLWDHKLLIFWQIHINYLNSFLISYSIIINYYIRPNIYYLDSCLCKYFSQGKILNPPTLILVHFFTLPWNYTLPSFTHLCLQNQKKCQH